MTLTLHFTDILLLVLTACGCALAVFAIITLRRMNAILASWPRTERKLDELLVGAKRLCDSAEDAMVSVKEVADQGTRVMVTAAAVTEQVRAVADGELSRLQGLLGVADMASAVFRSVRAGVAALWGHTGEGEAVAEPSEAASPGSPAG